jgi:hypothetical protein
MRIFFDVCLKQNLGLPEHLVFVAEDGTGGANLAAHQREGVGLIDYDGLTAEPGTTCFDSVHTCPDDPATPEADGGQEWFARLIADAVWVRPK